MPPSHTLAHRLEVSKVNDSGDLVTLNQLLHQRYIGHTARLASDALQALQNGGLAVGEIIKNDRREASFKQSDKGMAANVPGTAG